MYWYCGSSYNRGIPNHPNPLLDAGNAVAFAWEAEGQETAVPSQLLKSEAKDGLVIPIGCCDIKTRVLLWILLVNPVNA